VLDDRDDIARLRSGEVVEIRPSRNADVTVLLGELRRQLALEGLRAVPVSRLMHDGGVSV
jgi:hypothetical protein